MPCFKDTNGDEWSISITISDARRLKSLTEPIDLLNPESLKLVLDDYYSQFNLIWELCSKEAVSRDVQLDQFDRLLSEAEAFAAAKLALRQCLADFFIRAGRPELARVIDLSDEASERLQALATSKLNAPEVTAAIDRVVADAEQAIDQAIDEAIASLPSASHGPDGHVTNRDSANKAKQAVS